MSAPVHDRFRAFSERLKVPAIAAPMFLVSGPDLVRETARAGMAAAFPAPNARAIEELDAWMGGLNANVRETDAPWALNVVAHQSYARLGAELDLIAKHRPALVITALGSPRRVIDAVHSYGGLVFADVVDVGFARRCADAGVDGLVLVCAGAGGHTGQLSPFAFIPAVREFFSGPLVVGGAVTNGATIRALQIAGADLAYVGTPFIAAAESLAVDGYKQMVVASTLEDLVQTAAVTGVRANWLKPTLAAAGIDPSAAKQDGPVFSDPGSAFKRWKDTWSAGQGIGQVRGIEPASQIVERFAREYLAAHA